MSSISFDVFTLELKLDAVGTPHRTVSIPSFYTFDKLHSMIVWLFQWNDDHQHKFKIPINKNQLNKKQKQQQQHDDDFDEDSSSSLLHKNTNIEIIHNKSKQIKNKIKNKDIDQKNEKNLKQKDEITYYWVSDLKSFPSHCSNIKRKLESRVMLQNALHIKHDTILYQYDFDSKINSNWTIFITLLSTKSIRNFPISDFDPFEFVEIVDGHGKTIPEYEITDYDSINTGYLSPTYTSDYDREYEQELREYNPKRLNEELQIMRKQYTMFYEDYKKNKKKKLKMRENKKRNDNDNDNDNDSKDDNDNKDDSEYIDATTDATIDTSSIDTNSEYDESDTTTTTISDDEFLSTTESEIYHKRDNRYTEINDYDHILEYSNKKKSKIKTKNNRKRYLCSALFVVFCIVVFVLSVH